MLMIRTYSNKDKPYYDSIKELIKNIILEVCVFSGRAQKQAELINSYQRIAKTPLFISQDAEWGIGMRLDSVIDFPAQMTLGAMQNDSLVYFMATAIANDCKTVGVNINLAPVVDVNSNPENPVINFRSFGEDKINVVKKHNYMLMVCRIMAFWQQQSIFPATVILTLIRISLCL